MSHHLDSPLARQDVRLDITDLYAFRGEAGTALVINVCHSIAGEIPTPGYHHEGMYEFKIDRTGDAVEDVTYRFVFDERDADGTQTYVVRRIDGADAADPFAQGTVILTGTTDHEATSENGVRAWAGKAGDPFWIEPEVLHAVGHAFEDGTVVDLGEWTPDKAVNLFAGHTVYSMVLELPDEEILAGAAVGSTINVWAVASLATDAGGWRSINRIGLPMIHPLFTQNDEHLGDHLNEGVPSDDPAEFGPTLIRKVAGAVRANGTAEDPEEYAARVIAQFLPNVLPYRVGSQASFGFLERNGRTLTDNAPDVMFSIASNKPVTLSIGKESVPFTPRTTFPYVPAAE
jgi:hypothetical protein